MAPDIAEALITLGLITLLYGGYIALCIWIFGEKK